jgi:hypothetical protein
LVAFGRLSDETKIPQTLVLALDMRSAPASGISKCLHDNTFAASALNAFVCWGKATNREVNRRQEVKRIAPTDDGPKAIAQYVHNF